VLPSKHFSKDASFEYHLEIYCGIAMFPMALEATGNIALMHEQRKLCGFHVENIGNDTFGIRMAARLLIHGQTQHLRPGKVSSRHD